MRKNRESDCLSETSSSKCSTLQVSSALAPTFPSALPSGSPLSTSLSLDFPLTPTLLLEMPEMLVDMPLAVPWQLYLHFRSQPGSYKQAFMAWGNEFDSIGGFWSHFNALTLPSMTFTPPHQLGVEGNQIKAFSIFRGGVEPTWEDPVNAIGGESFCRCHLEKVVLDEIWTTLVLACVGQRLPGVVGVRVVDNSFRGAPTQSKVELWYPENIDPVDILPLVRGVLEEQIEQHKLPTFEHQSHVDKSTMERKFMSSLKRTTKKGGSASRRHH
jgi:hypothetical protein